MNQSHGTEDSKYLELEDIKNLIRFAFGINQTALAEEYIPGPDGFGIHKSTMANALKGKGYIGSLDLAGAFRNIHEKVLGNLYEKLGITGVEAEDYAIKQMFAYLERKGFLYPDIEAAKDEDFIDVAEAILTHYLPREIYESRIKDNKKEKSVKPPKTYEEALKKGDESTTDGEHLSALKFYEYAYEFISGDSDKERETINLYEKMADVYKKLGKYNESAKLYNLALHISNYMPDADILKTALLYQKLGIVQTKSDKTADAGKNLASALNIIEARLESDPNDPYVANLYNDIGLLNLNDKDFKSMKESYDKAFVMRKNNYDTYRSRTKGPKGELFYYAREYAYSLNNMGTYYKKIVTDRAERLTDSEKADCLQKAIYYHKEAYEMRMDLLGDEDALIAIIKGDPWERICLDISQSLTQLANDLMEVGEYESALEKCLRGLAIREAKFGKGARNKYIAWSYLNLGQIYDKMSEYDDALNYFKKSYDIGVEFTDGFQDFVAKALYQMGQVKYKTNDPSAKIDLYRARDIQLKLLDENDPEFLDTLNLIEQLESAVSH